MVRRRMLSNIHGDISPSHLIPSRAGDDQATDELSRKMLSWGSVWFGPSENSETTEHHHLVRERLIAWLKLCIGGQARGILARRGEDISLATSSQLVTAFLGRRAMRELSRRVLKDL